MASVGFELEPREWPPNVLPHGDGVVRFTHAEASRQRDRDTPPAVLRPEVVKPGAQSDRAEKRS